MNPKSDGFQTYITQFSAEVQPELKRRLNCKNKLEAKGLLKVLPLIWEAFLTPSKEVSDEGIKLLKLKAIENREKPENFLEEGNNTSTEARTLCLLEILFDLQEGIKMFPYEAYKSWVEVADNFGFWRLRYELEDEVFRNFDPEKYELFRSVLDKKLKSDEGLIKDVRFLIEISAAQQSVKNLSIYNREKNIYGIYQKVKTKKRNINDIYDIYGFRLITKTEAECYVLKDIIHRLWRHYPGRYKDYIRTPKENGYQSLHTVVNCLQKSTIEFQIRTEEMDEIASSGVANHAGYKKAFRDRK